MRMTAIYARVSSEQQREENTIASQTASLIEFANQHELEVPKEWVLEDEGYSGATLERPGLERVRDLAAAGPIEQKVCLPDSADRRVCPPRSGNVVRKVSARQQSGRSTPGAIPRHDRGIRTSPDPGALAAWQATPCPYRGSERNERRSLWLPLYPQDGRGARRLHYQ